MTKKVFSLIVFLLFLVIKGFSQQFYVSTDQGSLVLVTLTPTGPTTQVVTGCGGNALFSIAAAGNKIYYTTRGDVYAADITGGNSPTLINCKLTAVGPGDNAMTVDNNGTVYITGGNALYSIAANSNTYTYLGTMPYYSAGDLAFYNGSLFMAAAEGIIKIEIGDPANSKLYIPTPGLSIFGLATSSVNGNNIMYAITYDGTILPLDMQNKVVKGTVGSIPYDINDAAGVALFNQAPTIQLDAVSLTQECNVFNEAQAEVLCEPHTSKYTFTLNNGQSNETGVFENLIPGAYSVTVTASDNETPASLNFNVPDYTVKNPVINVTKINPACNLPGSIKLDVSTADSSYKIQYNNAVLSFGHTFTGLATGTYHFTILNPGGCIAGEKDYTLVQDACPPIVVTNVQIHPECSVYGQASVQVLTQAPPDSTTYTFTLNNVTDTTGIFDFLPPGTYTLAITSTGGTTFQQQVTVPDFTLNKPDITYQTKNAVCNVAGQVIFSASGIDTGSYKINYGVNTYKFNQTIKNLNLGSNHFIVFDGQGCIADTLNVNILQDICPPIVVTNILIQAECTVYGQASVQVLTQTPPDGTIYTFTLNNVSDTTGVFDFVPPGTYTLDITSTGGTTYQQEVTVPDFTLNKPDITYHAKNAVCNEAGQVIFLANGIDTSGYRISDGVNLYRFNEAIKNLNPGIIHFSVLNGLGCTVDTFDVNILRDNCDAVVFPNTFTPNGDGINDIFRPNQDANPDSYKLIIYTRWGAQIFQSQSVSNGWDGKYNGKPVASGVYYWIATFTMPGEEKKTISGYVTLIR